MKDSVFYRKHTLNLGGNILDLAKPKVMGILNVTPDSFYDGGSNVHLDVLLRKAAQMISDGASILDIGGYSSRPGAVAVSEEEELARVIPAIKAICTELPEANISIDTFRAEVAKQAIEAGAKLVNDISGGELDPKMYEILAHYKVPYVMMHMRGTPQNMKDNCNYENIISEMLDYFQNKLHKLHSLGISDIIIDLGFGFAKTREQNFFLLKNLSLFSILGCPVLAGVSRKSMIFKTLGISANEALNGTTALNMVALRNGASILRVHDVKEAMEVVKLNEELGVLNE